MEAMRSAMPWPRAPAQPAASPPGSTGSGGSTAPATPEGTDGYNEMMNALKELISPLSVSVDSLSSQLNRGVQEINTQISGIQGQMLQAEQNFQELQRAHLELSRSTQQNFDEIRKSQEANLERIRVIQEQSLMQHIQDTEISASRMREEFIGYVQSIKDEIAEMKAGDEGMGGTATPTDGRMTRRRVEVSDVGNPTRLVLLGFKRPLMEATLRQAADPILSKCSTAADRPGIQVKAFNCSKKVFLDFPCTLQATAFHHKAVAEGPFRFPNPDGGEDLELRVRRDLPQTARKLFYYLGNMRQAVANIFGAENVGSTGLGGTVYVLKNGTIPVQVVKVFVLDDGPNAGHAQMVVDSEGLAEIGGSQHAPCLQTRFFQIRPFR